MKSKILIGAVLLWSAIAPARADYFINQGSQTVIKSGVIGNAIVPYSTPVDASASPFGTLTNPFAMQFGTGVTLPAFTAPPHVICDSGCGGSSVQFGTAIGANGTPVGFKDGSGNFQALLGDVTNGQWVNVKASVAIPVTGTFFQATQPISAVSLPLPTGAATQTTLAALLSALGSPFQAGGSIGNTSFGISGTLPAFAATPTVNIGTAPSFAVTNVGTFAVQAAQSGTWNIGSITTLPALVAGSALVGKFGVDQTTPGSTNGVSLVPNNNAAGSIAPVPSTSAESGHVFKSSAGSTYSAAATNLTATAGFYVLIDAASVPADGAITPKACAPLPANGAVSINYGDIPGGFSTGIVGVVTSASTCLTKTTGVITAFLSGQVK